MFQIRTLQYNTLTWALGKGRAENWCWECTGSCQCRRPNGQCPTQAWHGWQLAPVQTRRELHHQATCCHVMCMWCACDVHVTHATYILQASWGSMPLSFHHWHRHQIQQLWALVQTYCYRAEKAELLHICAYIRTYVHTYILNSYALIIFAFLLWIQTHTYEHLALCTAANQ